MRKYLYWARPMPPKLILVGIALAIGAAIGYKLATSPANIHDFNSCVAAGNPILETYPEQCTHDGQSYFKPGQAPERPY